MWVGFNAFNEKELKRISNADPAVSGKIPPKIPSNQLREGLRAKIGCHISKQRILQPSSHHITAAQTVSPEGNSG